MYREKKPIAKRWIALILALALAFIWIMLFPLRGTLAEDIEQQSAQAVRDAVIRGAVQCYAVEGAYPSSLSYLEEHYGLIINHQKFIVSYEAYASNLMPEVRVLVRGDGA